MILLFVLSVLDNDKELFHHSNWGCRRIFPVDGADFLIGVFLTFHSKFDCKSHVVGVCRIV